MSLSLVPQRILKSQPVPENWDTATVKVLVGNTFDDVARDINKHAFVLISELFTLCQHSLSSISNRCHKGLQEMQGSLKTPVL